MNEENKKTFSVQNMFIPLAIIGAGVLIAGAIIFTSKTEETSASANNSEVPDIQSVNREDHILGNINTAKVFLVEFSDLECPFCKQFHQTMKQVMDNYGPQGSVAWVYRHFPLTGIHPKAPKEAEATECAAELGGEVKFWEYVDRLFAITPSNNGLDLALLPQIAEDIKLNRGAFIACLESGKYQKKVEEHLQDAVNSGGRGTPYTIAITKDGKKAIPVSGAQSKEAVRSVIEELLK